jgi:hypothetical protein
MPTMGFYERHVLPRVIDLTCGNRQLDEVRRPALQGLHGTVLELGFAVWAIVLLAIGIRTIERWSWPRTGVALGLFAVLAAFAEVALQTFG